MTYPTTITTLGDVFHLLAAYANDPKRTTEDDVRGEMRRYLTATSDDAKGAMSEIATSMWGKYPLDGSGSMLLVDTDDPTAPDGIGRTYYLTLTEIPR